jgi:hypothetical protein
MSWRVYGVLRDAVGGNVRRGGKKRVRRNLKVDLCEFSISAFLSRVLWNVGRSVGNPSKGSGYNLTQGLQAGINVSPSSLRTHCDIRRHNIRTTIPRPTFTAELAALVSKVVCILRSDISKCNL